MLNCFLVCFTVYYMIVNVFPIIIQYIRVLYHAHRTLVLFHPIQCVQTHHVFRWGWDSVSKPTLMSRVVIPLFIIDDKVALITAAEPVAIATGSTGLCKADHTMYRVPYIHPSLLAGSVKFKHFYTDRNYTY